MDGKMTLLRTNWHFTTDAHASAVIIRVTASGFFFKLEAGSSEQTPATSAAAAKLQDLTQWDLTAGALLGSFSMRKPSRGWNVQPKSFLLRAIRGANRADRPLAAFPRRDNKLMSCQGQKWEQIVSGGNKSTG